MDELTMSNEELARVAELKQIGFEVVGAGLSINPVKSTICYWRYMRGNRVSELHPFPEAAWRAAIREWDKNMAVVEGGRGSQRVKSMPADEAKQLSILKRRLMERGFTFSKEDKPDVDALDFNNYSHFWERKGMQVGMFKSHADAIRDAIKIWSRDEPEDFIAEMNQLAQGNMEGVKPLTADELRGLQKFGLSDLPLSQQKMVLESQMLMKHMAQRGIKVDILVRGTDDKGFLERNGGRTARKEDGWDGTGQPPVGTTLWVNPHNTIWGFSSMGEHLCQVLAYRDEYVWLELLSDIGENTYDFTTTRTDKVDFRVWKGNNEDITDAAQTPSPEE